MQIRYIGVADGGRELVRVERSGDEILIVPKGGLQQKGETTYFKQATQIKRGDVYLSDITLNREYGKVSKPHTPVIRAASPVYFENKIFGILVINMSFNQIFKDIIRNTPRELIPYVTNESGYYLAHPDFRKTYGFDLSNDHRIQNTYADFELQQTGDIRDTEFTVTTNGDVIHVVRTYFDPLNNERFFAVMLATSYDNLKSKSDTLRSQSITIMGILVLVSLVVASGLASRLMQPLKKITVASDDIAHGREVTDLPTEKADEIGDLARSFDAMRHQLDEKHRALMASQAHVHHSNKLASLGEMASGVAHEINTPVQTIMLLAQRVQRMIKKGDELKENDLDSSMEKITDNVDKISGIIDSLKKVSRDSSEDDFSNTTLGSLFEDMMNITEERFKVNDVHLQVNYENVSKDTEIFCQHLQISQVIINLVNNAYDAIDGLDEKWISINVSQVTNNIIFSVTDSGKGINPSVAERIFEPMYTTKDIGKGTGLGLSISREIVAKHGGALYLDSASPNTRFIIELPFR